MKAFTAGLPVNQHHNESQSNTNQASEETSVSIFDFLSSDSINQNNILYTDIVTQKEQYQKLIRTSNSLKIISPIVSSLMLIDDKPPTQAALIKSFKLILSKLNDAVEKIMAGQGLEPSSHENLWLRNQIEKHILDLILPLWSKKGGVNSTSVSSIVNKCISEIDLDAFSEKIDFVEPVERSTLNTYLFLFTNDVFLHLINSGVSNQCNKDIDEVMKLIFSTVNQELKKNCNKHMHESLKLSLFYQLSSSAVMIYKKAVDVEASRLRNALLRTPQEESKQKVALQSYHNNHSSNFMRIRDDFLIFFSRVSNMASRLQEE